MVRRLQYIFRDGGEPPPPIFRPAIRVEDGIQTIIIPPTADAEFLFLSTIDTHGDEEDERDLWPPKHTQGRQ
jgi:hypothetical protein